ncbi:hypothetical protein M407DRAFT_246896, partial [Tulasnella calospora MUT 4182]
FQRFGTSFNYREPSPRHSGYAPNTSHHYRLAQSKILSHRRRRVSPPSPPSTWHLSSNGSPQIALRKNQ